MALATALLIVACIAVIAGLALSKEGADEPLKESTVSEAATASEATPASATVSEPQAVALSTEAEAASEIAYCRVTLYGGAGIEIASREITDPAGLRLISALSEKANGAYENESALALGDIIAGNGGRVEIVYAVGGDTRVALVYELNGSFWQQGASRATVSEADCAAVFALFD